MTDAFGELMSIFRSLLSSIGALVTIFIQISRKDEGYRDWKSSTLALLFHGLDERGEVADSGQRLTRQQDMKEKERQ